MSLAPGGLLLVAAAVGVLAKLIATTWLPAVVVAAFAPYLMVGAPLSALTSLVLRTRRRLAAALVVTVAAGALELPLYVAVDASSKGRSLTLLTANLRHGTADAGALVDLVRAQHVDVLTVQELTSGEVARLRAAGLGGLLSEHAVHPGASPWGVGLWSRYPILRRSQDPRFGLGLISACLDMGPGSGEKLTVLAAHILAPIADGPSRWARELRQLGGVLDTQPTDTVLVGGDFNATDDHAQFRRLLSNGYHDAAEEAGAGVIRSYPADAPYPPLIGIDHVLARGARAITVRTVPIPGSDHRGLIAQLDIEQPEKSHR